MKMMELTEFEWDDAKRAGFSGMKRDSNNLVSLWATIHAQKPHTVIVDTNERHQQSDDLS